MIVFVFEDISPVPVVSPLPVVLSFPVPSSVLSPVLVLSSFPDLSSVFPVPEVLLLVVPSVDPPLVLSEGLTTTGV